APVSLVLYAEVAPRDRPAFPTRRSSELHACHYGRQVRFRGKVSVSGAPFDVTAFFRFAFERQKSKGHGPDLLTQSRGLCPLSARSEEHTSELQSREKLVCRLLLEKKKII